MCKFPHCRHIFSLLLTYFLDGGPPTLETLLQVNTDGISFTGISLNLLRTALSLLTLYAMKMGTYAWNFGDIFLIIVCRGIYFKFYQINKELQRFLQNVDTVSEAVTESEDSSKRERLYSIKLEGYTKQTCREEKDTWRKHHLHQIIIEWDKHRNAIRKAFSIPAKKKVRDEAEVKCSFTSWTDVREKTLAMCKLANEWTAFVMPLVLACYGCNLYLILERVTDLGFSYDNTGIFY